MTLTTATDPLVDLPADVRGVLTESLACEYASLTRDGRPVTWPVTPYRGAGTVDVSTGLTYPDKAERARRTPSVALSFSDPAGTTVDAPPVVLVEGTATVRDADLQANTDRYVRESLAKTAGFDGLPWFVVRRMGWYFARIWVEVTPDRVTWWPAGDLATPPQTWTSSGGRMAPPSDPAPAGRRLPSRAAAPVDWRPFADRAARLGRPVLTVNSGGRPVPLRTREVQRTASGYELLLPAGVETPAAGPVCLTFHEVGSGLRTQENVVLVGHLVSSDRDVVRVEVERALNDWSLAGTRRQSNRAFMGAGKQLKGRARAEAERRGQAVPMVRRPAR